MATDWWHHKNEHCSKPFTSNYPMSWNAANRENMSTSQLKEKKRKNCDNTCYGNTRHKVKVKVGLFVTYTIIQSTISSEMQGFFEEKYSITWGKWGEKKNNPQTPWGVHRDSINRPYTQGALFIHCIYWMIFSMQSEINCMNWSFRQTCKGMV